MTDIVPSGSQAVKQPEVPKPVEPPKEIKIEVPKPPDVPKPLLDLSDKHLYKLNVYSPRGTVRQDIPLAVYTDVSRRFGDIIKAISSNKWMTLDEIAEGVWRIEKKMKYPSNRTKKAIMTAIQDLIERTMVLVK